MGDCSSEGDIGSEEERSGLPKGAGPPEYLEDKMNRQKSQSCVVTVEDCSSEGNSSSDGEGSVFFTAVGDCSSEGDGSGLPKGAGPPEYLKDQMSRQRSQSCVITMGDCSSEGDISSESEGNVFVIAMEDCGSEEEGGFTPSDLHLP